MTHIDDQPVGIEPTLSPRFLVYLSNYLLDNGVDAEKFFNQGGINYSPYEEHGESIAVSKVAELFEEAAQVVDDDCLGLKIGRDFHFESSGLMVLTMMAAPSVKECLEALCRFDNHFETGLDISFSSNDRKSSVSIRLIGLFEKQSEQLNEYVVSFLFHALRIATRVTPPMLSIDFSHAPRKSVETYAKYFDAPVKFRQQSNTISFDNAYLSAPFLTKNRVVFETLSNVLQSFIVPTGERFDFAAAVSRELMRHPPEASLTLEVVAKDLGMTPRTLRRRLKDASYSFHDIKRLTREKRAKDFLVSTSLSLAVISEKLGFSEMSTFSRAFRTWTGEPPQAYRNRLRRDLSL